VAFISERQNKRGREENPEGEPGEGLPLGEPTVKSYITDNEIYGTTRPTTILNMLPVENSWVIQKVVSSEGSTTALA